MSKKDDERFHNVILTGAYATDEELGGASAFIIAAAVIGVVVFALYKAFA